MKKWGIKGTYVNTIHATYNRSITNIVLNWEKLEEFLLKPRTRKGCLLLMPSLNLVLEVLARSIRQENEMRWYKWEDRVQRYTACYASLVTWVWVPRAHGMLGTVAQPSGIPLCFSWEIKGDTGELPEASGSASLMYAAANSWDLVSNKIGSGINTSGCPLASTCAHGPYITHLSHTSLSNKGNGKERSQNIHVCIDIISYLKDSINLTWKLLNKYFQKSNGDLKQNKTLFYQNK